MHNLNSSTLNSLYEEQSIERVSDREEFYQNRFSDGLAMDFFLEEDKERLKVNQGKSMRKPLKFDEDVSF